jgi:hypothetical protein
VKTGEAERFRESNAIDGNCATPKPGTGKPAGTPEPDYSGMSLEAETLENSLHEDLVYNFIPDAQCLSHLPPALGALIDDRLTRRGTVLVLMIMVILIIDFRTKHKLRSLRIHMVANILIPILDILFIVVAVGPELTQHTPCAIRKGGCDTGHPLESMGRANGADGWWTRGAARRLC